MSISQNRPGQPPSGGSFSGCITFALIIIAIAGGALAGARWHSTLGSWMGAANSNTPDPALSAASNPGQLWTCSMHPQVIQKEPGVCPICHMQLVPLKGASGDNHASGTLEIDPAIVQNMGVRTTILARGPLYREIRAVGYLREAQPRVHDVTLRVTGWIEKLYADTEGMYVKPGDPLFDLYSPEIYQALSELISLKGRDGHGQTLSSTSAQRLQLWGLTAAQIEAYSSKPEAPRTVTILSPAEGHVLEKMVSEGSGIEAGMTLFKIVDHDVLWLDMSIFEMDLPFISLGQSVKAFVEALPGDAITGEIDFIFPHVNMETRTTTVRVSLHNPGMRLRPGMYATAQLDVILGEDVLLVPREAVINTGKRQIAFLDAGKGHFQLKELKVGNQGSDGLVEVLDGLSEGDTVVTSGQFLLDTESRLREAVQKFLSQEPQTTPDAGGDHVTPPPNGETQQSATETSPETDLLYMEYLKLSSSLGGPPGDDKPLDMKPLIGAAEALLANEAHPARVPASSLLDAAKAMDSKPLEDQRKAFGALSDALIALSIQFVPSGTVTPNLFVIHCPMADRSWIQPGEEVANPYYREEMKKCGTVVRAIPAMSEAPTS